MNGVMRAHRMVCLLALAGCSQAVILVPPATVGAAAATIREQGSAPLDGLDADSRRGVRVQVAATDVVKVELPRPELFGRTGPVSLSVDELLAGCPAGAIAMTDDTRMRYPTCQLAQARGELEVPGARHANWTTIIGVTAAGTAIGLGACALACDSPSNTVSGVALLGGVAVALTWSIILYARSPTSWH